jgi:hypothetical protein
MMMSKLDSMIKKAKQEIKLACSYDQLQTTFRRNLRRATKPNQTRAYVIVDNSEQDASTTELDDVNTLEFLRTPNPQKTRVELRGIGVLPFNLVMIDGGEAMWGNLQPTHAGQRTLWTNDTTQIDILKMAFEKIWQQSSKINANWARFYTNKRQSRRRLTEKTRGFPSQTPTHGNALCKNPANADPDLPKQKFRIFPRNILFPLVKNLMFDIPNPNSH